MKKLNNKGFAISTLLYGLMIVAFLVVTLLMSIMSSNRHNSSTLIDKIEEELNRYSQTVTEFAYSDETDVQEYIVPYGKAGWYRIELWGASSKDDTNLENKGRGAYASSIVYLPENQHLYFYIGAVGNGSQGGGSTDVRTISGNDAESKRSIFMLAAGGSETGSDNPGGYSKENPNGTGIKTYNDGGSFISGYPGVNAVDVNGAATNNTKSASLFAFHIDHDSNPDTPKVYSPAGTTEVMQMIIGGVNSGGGKAKIELVSQNDQNTLPTSKNINDSTGTSVLPKNGIWGVRFCVKNMKTGTTNNGKQLFKEMQLISADGTNILKGASLSGDSRMTNTEKSQLTDGKNVSITRSQTYTSANNCIEYSSSNSLDYNFVETVAFPSIDSEILKTEDGNYTHFTIEVAYAPNIWTEVKHVRTITNYENYYGIRLSNYELDYASIIPTANYFISTRANYTKMLTASYSSGKTVEYKFNAASKNQRWTIQLVGSDANGNYYKITETQNNYALQPHDQGKEVGEIVSVGDEEYTGKSWQHWYIYRQENGYYQFKSVSAKNGINEDAPDQDLCLSANRTDGVMTIETCAGGETGSGKQYFKLTPLDY